MRLSQAAIGRLGLGEFGKVLDASFAACLALRRHGSDGWLPPLQRPSCRVLAPSSTPGLWGARIGNGSQVGRAGAGRVSGAAGQAHARPMQAAGIKSIKYSQKFRSGVSLQTCRNRLSGTWPYMLVVRMSLWSQAYGVHVSTVPRSVRRPDALPSSLMQTWSPQVFVLFKCSERPGQAPDSANNKHSCDRG